MTSDGSQAVRNWGEQCVLAVLVCLGAYLRFSGLGTPSLWWDEIIVPLMSRFTVGTIMAWASVFEPNPPYFHIFTKIPVWLGGSEALLRAPSALVGSATPALVYLFCRRHFTGTAGLFAAALLVVNPLHILISRQVRPYTIVVCCLLLALMLLISYSRSGRKRTLVWLALANALALGLHYSSVLFVAAQSAWLFLSAFRDRSGGVLRRACWHAGSAVLSFVPIAPFFFPTVFARSDMVNAKVSGLSILEQIPRFFREMVVYFDGFVPGWTVTLLFAATVAFLVGVWKAWRRNPDVACLLACNMAVPLVLIVAGRSSFLFARYLFFCYLSVLVFQGVALGLVLGRRPLLAWSFAAGIAAAGALYIPVHYSGWFYAPDAYMNFGPGGTYAEDARGLGAARGQGRFEVYEDEGLRQALRWQTTHSLAPVPGDEMRISPDDGKALLTFVSGGGVAQLAGNEAALFTKLGQPMRMESFRRIKEYTWLVDREPVHRTDGGTKYFSFDAWPGSFVRDVYSASFVQVLPMWGNSIIPTVNGKDAMIEYAVDCPDDSWYYHVFLEIHMCNRGSDSIFKVWAVFDGEEQILYASKGPDSRGMLKLSVFRDKPYKRFTLRMVMNSAPTTPNYPGSNLDLIQFRKCVVGFLCPQKRSGT